MALRPAGDILRFVLVAFAFTAAGAEWDSPLIFAHLNRWASRIRFRASALNLRLVRLVEACSTVSGSDVPSSMARRSAI